MKKEEIEEILFVAKKCEIPEEYLKKLEELYDRCLELEAKVPRCTV